MQKFRGWLSAGLEQRQGPFLGRATSRDAGGCLLYHFRQVWLSPTRPPCWPPAGFWSGSVPGYEPDNLLTLLSVIPQMEAQGEPKGDSFSLSPTWFCSKLTISSQACVRSWKTARPDAGLDAKPSVEEGVVGRGCPSAPPPWQPPCPRDPEAESRLSRQWVRSRFPFHMVSRMGLCVIGGAVE